MYFKYKHHKSTSKKTHGILQVRENNAKFTFLLAALVSKDFELIANTRLASGLAVFHTVYLIWFSLLAKIKELMRK